MRSEYLALVILMALGAAIAAAMPLLSWFLGPRRPDPVKDAAFECGVADLDSIAKRTHVRYYMTALLFLVFDIEIAFLYPWAVVLKRFDAKLFLFGEMVVFLSVLFLAYVWLWRKGALEWD